MPGLSRRPAGPACVRHAPLSACRLTVPGALQRLAWRAFNAFEADFMKLSIRRNKPRPDLSPLRKKGPNTMQFRYRDKLKLKVINNSNQLKIKFASQIDKNKLNVKTPRCAASQGGCWRWNHRGDSSRPSDKAFSPAHGRGPCALSCAAAALSATGFFKHAKPFLASRTLAGVGTSDWQCEKS